MKQVSKNPGLNCHSVTRSEVRRPFQFIFEAAGTAGYLFMKNQRVWQGIMFKMRGKRGNLSRTI